jgi:hypothetical protein
MGGTPALSRGWARVSGCARVGSRVRAGSNLTRGFLKPAPPTPYTVQPRNSGKVRASGAGIMGPTMPVRKCPIRPGELALQGPCSLGWGKLQGRWGRKLVPAREIFFGRSPQVSGCVTSITSQVGKLLEPLSVYINNPFL